MFPWPSIGRILVETVLASAVAGLAIGAIGGLQGLVISAVLYVAAFAVLIALFERDLLARARAIARGSAP